jgi:ADP-heptose:LPS heptosyltransferase
MIFPEIKKQEFFDDSITVFDAEIKDFLDTAKLINSVDVVISVDTAVLHLAGAMDKNTYAILPEDTDERWAGGSKSIWYPSIRMFKGKTKDSLKSIKILLDVKKQLN